MTKPYWQKFTAYVNDHPKTVVAALVAFLFFTFGFGIYLSYGLPILKVISILLIQLSSALLVAMLVRFFYETSRDNLEGNAIWKVFNELSDGGIIRFFKDRKVDQGMEILKREFAAADGTVKIVGVSLKAFFHANSAYFEAITTNKKISIQALIANPNSVEAQSRDVIQDLNEIPGGTTRLDVKRTGDMINHLMKEVLVNRIYYGYYDAAPYCTLIIFKTKCFFIPNLLTCDNNSLPMILFQNVGEKREPGETKIEKKALSNYAKLNDYFDDLWKRRKEPTELHDYKCKQECLDKRGIQPKTSNGVNTAIAGGNEGGQSQTVA